jgi:hypothetical protein
VNNDAIVDDQVPPDASGDASHGTSTLACIAGSKPGTYSGAAYGCTVALGKTEYVATETPDRDGQLAARRRVGRQPGRGRPDLEPRLHHVRLAVPGYTQADLDGQTTVVTRAARRGRASRHHVVVTAAGNEGPARAVPDRSGRRRHRDHGRRRRLVQRRHGLQLARADRRTGASSPTSSRWAAAVYLPSFTNARPRAARAARRSPRR